MSSSGLLEEVSEAVQSIEANIGTLNEEKINDLKEKIDELKEKVAEHSDYLSDINTALYGDDNTPANIPSYDGHIIEGKWKGINGFQKEMCLHVYVMDEKLDKVIELLTNINDNLTLLNDNLTADKVK